MTNAEQIGSEVVLLRSARNRGHLAELARRLPRSSWIDRPMPETLAGDGESAVEAATLCAVLGELLGPTTADLVVYSRAYGAFSAASRERLARLVRRPLVTAPGAVLAEFARLDARRLAVLTPYPDQRHRYEIDWLVASGFSVVDAAQVDGGSHDPTRIGVDQLIAAHRELGAADAIYVACTMLPLSALLPFADAVRPPVVSATGALLDHADAALQRVWPSQTAVLDGPPQGRDR